VKILDSKRFFWKRIISEMLYIQLQNNRLNYQTDTEYIQTTHIHINFKQILNTQTLILVIMYFNVISIHCFYYFDLLL